MALPATITGRSSTIIETHTDYFKASFAVMATL